MTIEELRINTTTDYLGDSVYAFRDQQTGDLVLCTCNGRDPENLIALEKPVLENLLNYCRRQKLIP